VVDVVAGVVALVVVVAVEPQDAKTPPSPAPTLRPDTDMRGVRGVYRMPGHLSTTRWLNVGWAGLRPKLAQYEVLQQAANSRWRDPDLNRGHHEFSVHRRTASGSVHGREKPHPLIVVDGRPGESGRLFQLRYAQHLHHTPPRPLPLRSPTTCDAAPLLSHGPTPRVGRKDAMACMPLLCTLE
jgi:hypothetical protein